MSKRPHSIGYVDTPRYGHKDRQRGEDMTATVGITLAMVVLYLSVLFFI